MNNGKRSAAHWGFGKAFKDCFANIFPDNVCEAALATCRFEIRGLRSNGNEWGIGFLTHMQTFGRIPRGCTSVQIKGNFTQLTSHESANVILDCFGLTTEDVFRHYGAPSPGDRMVLDLFTVIQDITAKTERVVA